MGRSDVLQHVMAIDQGGALMTVTPMLHYSGQQHLT